jgi:ferredoxin--NADP+ reductase
MFEIAHREDLAPTVHLFQIHAPDVARKARPGQFIMLMVDEEGERIPLTIADWDKDSGNVSIVVSAVGKTTRKLATLRQGDSVAHFVGPLGRPSSIDRYGRVACVAMGYGKFAMVPIARALREAGNEVCSVVSATTKDDLFGMERLGSVSDSMTATTSDGSYGEHGWVIAPLKRLLDSDTPVGRVYAIGSICMMRLVSAMTNGRNIPTLVSLNPIMVDGTGMCGACRVSVGGCTKFACVDGPEFDGHQVDWDLLQARRCTYPVPLEMAATTTRCLSCGQW